MHQDSVRGDRQAGTVARTTLGLVVATHHGGTSVGISSGRGRTSDRAVPLSLLNACAGNVPVTHTAMHLRTPHPMTAEAGSPSLRQREWQGRDFRRWRDSAIECGITPCTPQCHHIWWHHNAGGHRYRRSRVGLYIAGRGFETARSRRARRQIRAVAFNPVAGGIRIRVVPASGISNGRGRRTRKWMKSWTGWRRSVPRSCSTITGGRRAPTRMTT